MNWVFVITALKTALSQIAIALLTSAFIKEIILKLLKWIAAKTKTKKDDEIVKLADDALHGRLENPASVEDAQHDSAAKICPKCKTVLDQ